MEKQLSVFGFECKTDKTVKSTEQAKAAVKEVFARKPTAECKIFVDGAARGNPGPAGAGIYIAYSDEEIKGAFYLGEKTNNQAEYLALILALFLIKQKFNASDLKNMSLTIHSDSELLVRQLSGLYKIKNSVLIEMNGAVKQVLKGVPHKFVHVLREKNKIADKLANEGIDKKKKIPTNFFNFLADLSDVDYIVEMLKK